MNLDELNDALSASDPDPGTVLAQMDRKRRRGRQRLLGASGGVAVLVVAVVIAGGLLSGIIKGSPGSAMSSSSAPAAAAAPRPSSAAASANGSKAPAPTAPDSGSGAAATPRNTFGAAGSQGSGQSCAGVPLQDAIAAAVRQGASVIVATGTLTGKSVTGSPAGAFYAMTLSSVRTLRGPAIATGTTAWVPGPAPGAKASVTSALLAPGGRLFAIATPKSVTNDLVGPTLRLAPIVGGDVVFTPSGCWDLTGLQPSQYQANTPLRAVPDGTTLGGESHQAAENGLYTIPLATVEQITAQA